LCLTGDDLFLCLVVAVRFFIALAYFFYFIYCSVCGSVYVLLMVLGWWEFFWVFCSDSSYRFDFFFFVFSFLLFVIVCLIFGSEPFRNLEICYLRVRVSQTKVSADFGHV
jgi:hypothetical protein